MTGRERIVALAEAGDLSSLIPLILKANAAAIDDIDGDGTDRVFVTTLIANLGLKRPNGRPAATVNYETVRAIVDLAYAGNAKLSEGSLKRAVGKACGVSGNTALKHVRPAMLIPAILRTNKTLSLIPPRTR